VAGKPPLNEVKAEVAEAARLTSIYDSMQRGENVTPKTTLVEVLTAHVKALRAIQAALDFP
jgi:hypothetical protein